MPELPRITRSLRMFTNLGRIKSTVELEPNDLFKKQTEEINKFRSESTWKDLRQTVPKDALPYLTKLRKMIEQLFEEGSYELINEFLIFALRLLIDERLLTNAKFQTLKERAENLTYKDANMIMEIIGTLREKLNEDTITLLKNEKKDINTTEILETDLFGSKFTYNPPRVLWPDTEALRNMSVGNIIQNADNFTMKYKKEIPKSFNMKFDEATYKKNLNLCHKKYSLVMSFDQFETAIINKLKDSKNLQNELFDFLGYEHIELVQYIIQNQKSIMALKSSSKTQKQPNIERPVIGGQVTVQSEKEKQALKQMRKEEKKLNKISNKGKGDLEENNFESQELYLKKQEVLVEMNKPIFKKDIVEKPIYPFVFDSNVSSGSTTCISGKKIMLPQNVVRKDTQMSEEVHIPIPELRPIDIDYKPITISSLDDIGQMAFNGITSLNRVQSIVFNTAYHTNENLLICAPTGAGKTNVAMLTVVHQLKQHIENGQIMKDQFKIIYVTPMKALAAEMTTNFGKRLKSLGISVRELTGDMQLTKSEIQQTQMIVTTPEKWDVLTRKGTGDISLTNIVKLLIIDEVHLLHGDRGPVVEALVARTLRQVESSQNMIRIVGLSATLPNYVDVARFLRVNPLVGLFYFDYRFRPVPLSQTFIGVKAGSPYQQAKYMDHICYDNVIEMVRKGHQVMVFVHARNATVRVANVLKELAQQNDMLKLFLSEGHAKFINKAFAKSRNKHLIELFNNGLSIHHAGLLRSERNLVEKYFAEGLIKVLVCTSTLAWGVNLPAHGVIIRGTEIYDSKHGSFINLDILDVLQIFGRAGRPQFDTSGHAVIITSHNNLYHYLSLLTNQIPIESNFIRYLADNLNAEVALGTISNVEEAIKWLSYTYLFVRMQLNHLEYGIPASEDLNLERKRRELINTAATSLDKAKMIRYNVNTGDLSATELGRIASHFYLKYDTVEIFNEMMKDIMNEADILVMISHSQEFQQLKVRDDEIDELEKLLNCCQVPIQGGVENIHGKVNILLQTYLSHGPVNTFSLMSDQAYITQNAVRICRALFKIMLEKNNATMAGRLLEMSKMFEIPQWDYLTPLRQFSCLPSEIIDKIEHLDLTIDRLNDMDVKEIADVLHNQKAAALVKKCCEEFPALEMESNLQPITRTILRIRLKIIPQFRWNDKVHGQTSVPFWIWIENPEDNIIYHHEYFVMTRKMVYNNLEQELVMTIPLQEPIPTQYIVKATSDHWLNCESMLPLTFHDLILPEIYPPYTDLLTLQPLPVKALKEKSFEQLYKFSHFNPIQTQIFHCLYHTDNNVLLGAPTGSGKTVAAEIAMFRVFKQYPMQKVVYIAPLKALVRERIKDWKIRLEERLGKKVVELTGDVTPDIKVIANANVIVTTPEKWDGISRSWQTRTYVKNVSLIIIDEIHLLGEDRGPVLEVIISRTNFISSHTLRTVRIVGLSTALANAVDLANWLGIKEMGLYNFRPSVRPVPLEIHINGFPGKHYCPRMATMNRPTFQAIRQHAPSSPSLVFVSSRRQTRLTALNLIAYLAAEDKPKQWLHMPDEEMDSILDQIKDSNLKLTLAFGIGLHHAGLQDRDRRTVEELFVNNRIQVLITTATLAWGVNFPAHLVVIKGTEYYDGKTKRYVDMPITDVLQMMGRAGRPQFDTSGVAVVLVYNLKKNFYKNFLHQPFPVESSLLAVLPDHINAEIVAGTIKNKQEFLDYLTWTYFIRRLMKNPKYYNLDVLNHYAINEYLSSLVNKTLKVLIDSQCVDFDEERQVLYPLPMGRIASFYYLSHQSMLMFQQSLQESLTLDQCLHILCDSYEYSELPVRHNEELLNEELSKMCRYTVNNYTYDSPHTKAFLLLQAHFSRLPLPCTDYTTDLKSVLDQAIRIIQAMIDTVAEHGWLASALTIIQLLQMIIQARWIDEPAITTLPYVNSEHLELFLPLSTILPVLCATMYNKYNVLVEVLGKEFQEEQIHQIHQVIKEMPMLCLDLSLAGHGLNDTKQKFISLQSNNSECINIHKDQDYILNIGMRRKNKSNNLKAHCSMFQKGKDEGWFIVLGSIQSRELLALKRVSGISGERKCHQLQFTAPSDLGKTTLTFYLMSDCYIGLDQQYNVQINVI
ncbi:activating signal cointegrator 1 complex subunit obelus [Osmia lignaria lignaria]|uniref:activating signal cointegrator 1 complex subunit obelus n=1 Tax=Osmia lignaria lignaria TaxID=1437193 RepID=UPI00147838E1|nr:activating signal cointegrator 1 complex subunit 3 [Osmia lignaria]XP_034181077.1 activating signal cointegrator 1 complex subunit 3 [Osmia lignaria]XP_034181078.1 activating signal cointegrator 1 complex subunit 3 [Osmia lignaria]XP_034181079.1 activating signal cointegrator 1 complex subunit 3 [Osmia lignaria]XP_034181080.1 activating signal cointegrator 1 complex subunit 3 [Osmia lignaria]